MRVAMMLQAPSYVGQTTSSKVITNGDDKRPISALPSRRSCELSSGPPFGDFRSLLVASSGRSNAMGWPVTIFSEAQLLNEGAGTKGERGRSSQG